MANYATLKSAIEQVIKTNGNNEITGALLQQSLLSMITSLGAGYQFVGVATPSTSPGTPDYNVFYIGGPGTYSNFGGLVVNNGEIGVFRYNGTWNNQKFSAVDSINSITGCYLDSRISSCIEITADESISGTSRPVSVVLPTGQYQLRKPATKYLTGTTLSGTGSFYHWVVYDSANDQFSLLTNLSSQYNLGMTILAVIITAWGGTQPKCICFSPLYKYNGVLYEPFSKTMIPAPPDLSNYLNNDNIYKYVSSVCGYFADSRPNNYIEITATSSGVSAQISVVLPSGTYVLRNSVLKSLTGTTLTATGAYYYLVVYDPDTNTFAILPNANNFTTKMTLLAVICTGWSSMPIKAICFTPVYKYNGSLFEPFTKDWINDFVTEQGVRNIFDSFGLSSIFVDKTNQNIVPLQENVPGFYSTAGQLITTLSDWKHDIYYIGNFNPTSLLGSTSFNTGSGVPVFVFFDSNMGFLGYQELQSGNVPTTYTNFELVNYLPTGTTYVVIQKHPDSVVTSLIGSGRFVAADAKTIEKMQDDIAELQEEIGPSELPENDERPRITFYLTASYFAVRASLNDTQDIVIRYDMHANGYYAPKSAFIGTKDESLTTIMGHTRFHNTGDSIAPVQTANYWFIGGEHGYLVPRITSTGHDKTSADIGSWWKDTNNHQFQLIEISDNYLTFAPRITVGPDGAGISDYSYGYVMTDLTHVSGATHTSTIVVTTNGSVQLRPCTANVTNEFVVNGKKITSDDYNKEIICTELKFIASADILNPATLTHILPSPMVGTPWFNITQTFLFIGLSCSVRQNFKIYSILPIVYYGATQPLGLTDYGNYHSYMFTPKVKALTSGGITTDWKLPQDVTTPNQSWGGTHFYNSAQYVEDLNNLPDRVIEYYKNPNTNQYLIGFASGLSLLKSGTVNTKRSQNIGADGPVFHIANDGRNKLYFRVITGSGIIGTNLPGNFTLNFNYYQCYYDPNNGDALTYWYKEGDKYVIYVHAFTAIQSAKIVLPQFLDGKNLSVVEKTDDTELLTDGIEDNVFYVRFNSANPNYIVVETEA